MIPFYTPRKYHKNQRSPDIFRGCKKRISVWNGLKIAQKYSKNTSMNFFKHFSYLEEPEFSHLKQIATLFEVNSFA